MQRQSEVITRIGINVQAFRIKANLSQAALAAKCSLTREFINKLELGKVNVSVKALERIACALCIDTSQLFKVKPRKKASTKHKKLTISFTF